MAKRRDRSEVEYYRGKLREVEAENRRLRKQLRSAEKSFEYLVEADSFENTEYDAKCPNCGKGELKFTDLKIKTLTTCSICDYRKTTRNEEI